MKIQIKSLSMDVMAKINNEKALICHRLGYNSLISDKILNSILTRRAFIRAKQLKRPLTENELAWVHYVDYHVTKQQTNYNNITNKLVDRVLTPDLLQRTA